MHGQYKLSARDEKRWQRELFKSWKGHPFATFGYGKKTKIYQSEEIEKMKNQEKPEKSENTEKSEN